MSSDNFDLEDEYGNVWPNLSASEYWDLSPEALVYLANFYGWESELDPSDYTEYGVWKAGPVTIEHQVEALTYLVKRLWGNDSRRGK